MKLMLVFLSAGIIALSSCSSAYKTAQTPDDVYYSPRTESAAPTNGNNSNNNSNQGEYYNANPNDQYLMMKVEDPSSNRWSSFDDYGYDSYYAPYSGFGMGFGYGSFYPSYMGFGYGWNLWNPYYSYYNNYYAWNAFYNPYYYYGNAVYAGGKYSPYNTYSGLQPFNVGAYRNTAFNNTNVRYTPSSNFTTRNRNSFNSTRSAYYNNSNNNNFNNNRTFSQPTRSYNPSPSSFGGGARSGGGGGGFSRPGRP